MIGQRDLEQKILFFIKVKVFKKMLLIKNDGHTLITLLRVPNLCYFGSTSFVLPIRPKNCIEFIRDKKNFGLL